MVAAEQRTAADQRLPAGDLHNSMDQSTARQAV